MKHVSSPTFLATAATLVWVAALVALTTPRAFAQSAPETSPKAAVAATPYTLEQAIAAGLANHPTLAASKASAAGAWARVDETKAAMRPTLSVGASAGIGGSESTAPGNEREWFEPVTDYRATASASWRIWDFGQNRAQRRASEASAAVADASVATTELDLRTSIASAYLETVARKLLVKVGGEALEREQFYLEQAIASVAAGAKAPIEKAQAQSRVASARTALIRAETNLDLARANLREAMGITDTRALIDVVDGWPWEWKREPAPLPTLLSSALQARPEFRQLTEQLRAAEQSKRAASLGQAPVLSASGSAQQPLFTGDAETPSWQVGLGLSWSLFDGGRRRAGVREAEASHAAAIAQLEALRLRLSAEIETAWVGIRSGRATVESANEAVAYAKEQLTLAEARYAQGLGSRIELSEAQSGVISAEGQRIEAEWNLAAAWLALQRATGEP